MKLLTNPIFEEIEVKFVTEGENRKKWYIQGPFSFHSLRNKNGRIYPEKVLDREIGKFQKLIETGQAVGELDHPDSPKLNLKNISHRIVSIKKSGNCYEGKGVLLDTPSGKIAQNLAENGVKLGISSRALGTLTDSDEGKVVNEDLHLITWDLVARPSFSEAVLSAVYEGKEWDIVEGEIIESTKNKKLSDEKIQSLLEEIKKWRDLYYQQLLINSIRK